LRARGRGGGGNKRCRTQILPLSEILQIERRKEKIAIIIEDE